MALAWPMGQSHEEAGTATGRQSLPIHRGERAAAGSPQTAMMRELMLLALLPAAARATCVGCVMSRRDWKLKWYEKNTNCGTYLGVRKGSLNTCTAGGWYPELSDGTFDAQPGVRNDTVTYAPRTMAKVTKCDTEGATIELGEGITRRRGITTRRTRIPQGIIPGRR